MVASFFGGYILGGFDNNNRSSIQVSDTNFPLQEINPSQSPQPDSTFPQRVQISADNDPAKRSENTSLTIIEFSDFQCPFCERFSSQTLPLLQSNYIETGRVNLVFRDFPIDSIHPNAFAAALAAECADDQGKFWEYHDMLFANQLNWSPLANEDAKTRFIELASELSLNVTEFTECIQSEKHIDEVIQDQRYGEQRGVTATPTFFIGSDENGYTMIVGAQPFSVFDQMLRAELGPAS